MRFDVYRRAALALTLLFGVSATGSNGAAPRAADRVQVQMRNVDLHVDERTVLHVRQLRGELESTRRGEPPIFDDRNSFVVLIDTAEIAISADSLSRLMNQYVFNYEGAPFRRLDVSTEGARLKVKGTVHKGADVPFTILAEPSVDRDGNLRLHATSIKALGIPAKALLSLFGVELEKLVHVEKGRGVRLEGDDFILEPRTLVPPPRIEGRLQAVRVERGSVVQVFGPGHLAPLHPPDRKAPNYMYYRGGVLRFGKLTMTDADLELIDRNPSDPFDFFQDRYNEQLVAGYSKNTPQHGLEVYMPDYYRLHSRRGG